MEDNFYASLNLHDAHCDAWLMQLDESHPAKLNEVVRKAESDSMANAFDYWLLRDELGSKQRHPESDDAPAQAPATPAPVGMAAVVIDPKGPKARKTWRTESFEYIVGVYRSGSFSTAEVFYKTLLSKVDSIDSPFINHRGELFLKVIGKTVANKTIANNLPKIKRAALNVKL
jgi:hypothetical protein